MLATTAAAARSLSTLLVLLPLLYGWGSNHCLHTSLLRLACCCLVVLQAHPNQFVAGLALTTLGNIGSAVRSPPRCSTLRTHPLPHVMMMTTTRSTGNSSLLQEMARDLATDVDRHLRGDNGYTRKKAALCCIRLLRKGSCAPLLAP